MNLPITLLVRYISKKKQREALAGSMVKIKAKDVIASWKVIVASIATPALYGFYSVLYLVFLVLRRPKLSLSSKMTRVTLSWIIQPILHYVMMRMGDTGFDIYKSIKPLFLALRNPEVGRLLRDMRADLSQDITAFVNAHADVLLPDTANEAAAAATHLKHDRVSSSPAIPVSG
ncbi:hypothetical protein BC940DRAFT_326204 [Gongronella butleri]|nr:hypothetical protein BC940DRAFT_326204 [Gongronella butleri]